MRRKSSISGGKILPKTTEKKKVERIGRNPEDFEEYSEYKGPKILVRNLSSLSNIEEGEAVIINTNTPSPLNPLAGSYVYGQKTELSRKMDHCSHHNNISNSSVHQTLEEMDFERGIWTPAMSGDVDQIKNHLNKGTNPDSEDKAGYTPLHYAARCGHPHVCAILLEAGASIDKRTRAGGATALHRAALAGHLEICRILLHYGGSALSKDIDGRTPLHRAVEGGHEEVISLFLEKTPSAALEKDNQGKTPLEYAETRKTLTSLFTKSQ